jgi:hypothetical protein
LEIAVADLFLSILMWFLQTFLGQALSAILSAITGGAAA